MPVTTSIYIHDPVDYRIVFARVRRPDRGFGPHENRRRRDHGIHHH
jgi:hypothetical protein